jgi:hypothetical protein
MLIVWEHKVLLFSIACHGVLLWRLWSQKLAGVYLFLGMFLAGEMLQNITLLPIGQYSNLYARIFFLSTPVLWVLAYLVVLELYRLILADYPGIASVGRKAVSWSMGLAIVISAIYGLSDRSLSGAQYPLLHLYYLLERSTVLGLLLFLVLIQLFLFRYRLKLSRNNIVYVTGYALYFGIGIAGDIVMTALGVRVGVPLSLWIVTAAGVLLLAGATLLSREGEVRIDSPLEDADGGNLHLQQQLIDMNKLLSRAARGRG